MKDTLKQALERIKPTKGEEKEVSAKINAILRKINSGLKDGKAILGGSGVKGTWLKDAHDADLFVCFNYDKYKNKSSELSGILEKHLKKKFRVTRLHGSRDYFQIKEKDFTYEIIPILEIKKAEQAKNITDVSPLHAKWVKRHKRLSDEMRLLKQFCKASNVYGAESYIRGFSGYICEILTVYYGSFLNVLKNAFKWKDRVIVDAEGYYKNKNVLDEMNKSKTQSPMVVIDPVQADRNAAAALSREKFELFKKKAGKFLKKPSKGFFEEEEFSIADVNARAGDNELILLDVWALGGKKDIVGCKLLKALEFINRQLERNEFKVLEHGWHWNKEAVFYFIVKKGLLPRTKVHVGPPLSAKQHVKVFREKYKRTFVQDKRVKARIERKYVNAKELVKDLIKDRDVKTRVKKIKVV